MYQEINGKAPPKFTRTGSQICPSPEEELLEAVLSNNTLKISEVIQKDDYLLNSIYRKFDKKILLIACSEDVVNAETVNTLLSLKANPRDFNHEDGWEALHYAAYKADYDILDVLLKHNPGDVNNKDKYNQNALHILIRCGKRQSQDILKCAELLVKKGIDVTCEDSNCRTPLFWANRKGIGEDIRRIIDEYSFFKGNVSQQISNNNLQNEQGSTLLNYLKQGNQDSFTKFEAIKKYMDYSDGTITLLQICCQKGLTECAEYLLENGATADLATIKNKSKPIEIAAENGCVEIFNMLLGKYEHISLLPKGLLCLILKSIDIDGSIDCYKSLIELYKKADPDEASLKLNETDTASNTSLHYAIRFTDDKIVDELLSLGASLGAKNRFGVMPVHDIEPDTLEKHLDKCVIFDLKRKQTEKQAFQVKFKYRSIIPPYAKSNYNDIKSCEDLEATGINTTVEKELVAETEVISFMSKSPEFKHLLNHPVIVSFLFMKWLRIQWLFWTNLAFYVTFALSLVLYIFLDYAYFSIEEKSTIQNILAKLSYVFLVITLIILILRELFQICVAPIKYLKNVENYMEITLIILTTVIVFVSVSSPDTRKQLSSVSILLAAFDLVLMLGNHPYFSTNVVMLKTVSLNFFKFLMWYSLLIIAFALSFYLLFTRNTIETQSGNSSTEVSNLIQDNATSNEEGETDKSFDNPGRSVFKTIIMLTGEFDASDINFDTFPITSQIIFALFIFMIAIILLNLLNGLAVSDTQMIKNDAELVGHIARAQHIRYVESMLVGNILPANVIKKISDFCCCLPIRFNWNYKLGKILAKNASLFPKYLNYELTFYPNKRGLIGTDLFNKTNCGRCSAIYLDRETINRTNDIVRASKNEELNERSIIKFTKELETLKDLILDLHPANKN